MAKQPVRIALAKFWSPAVTVEGLFAGLPYLFDHFEFIPSAEPDFILFGDSPGELPPGDAVRIFYTGENVRPDFSACDWAFSFDYDEELRHPRHLRLPNYVRLGAGRVRRTRGPLRTERPRNAGHRRSSRCRPH